MLPFDVIYFLLCGFETVAQGDDAVVNAGVLGVRGKEAGAHELEFLTGLCILQAFFQLAALAHNNAFRVQVVLVIAALGDGVHVGLGEQLVVQAHLGVDAVGSADPMDGALDLAAVGGVAVAGLQVGGAVDGSDAAVRVLVHTGALDDVGTHQADFPAEGQALELGRRHLGKVLVGVVFQKRQRAREVELRVGGHGVDRDAALLDGKRRVLQKALLQMHRGGLVGVFSLALVLDERVHNCLNHIRKRQQDHDLHKAEEGVDKRDGNARHRHIHKIEPEHGVRKIKDRRPEHNARDFDHEIDHGRALAVNVRADCGQKHRQRRADGNAHDDGKGDGKIDHARRRQRLQNTDRRRRALQHAGKERTK